MNIFQRKDAKTQSFRKPFLAPSRLCAFALKSLNADRPHPGSGSLHPAQTHPRNQNPESFRGWTLDVLNIVRRITEEKHAIVLDCGGKRSATPLLLRKQPSSQSGVTAAALQNEFTTADVYAFERELEKLHPDNRHVRDKIRQQLQILRDTGLLIHVESGRWRLP